MANNLVDTEQSMSVEEFEAQDKQRLIEQQPRGEPITEQPMSVADFEAYDAQNSLVPVVDTPPIVNSIPDEHKDFFVRKLGDELYNGIINTLLSVGGDTQAFMASANRLVGMTGLSLIPGYTETFVEGPLQLATQAKEAIQPRNMAEEFFYSTVGSVGSLPMAVIFDSMTGGVTKLALAGKVVPQMEFMLSKLHPFVLGTAWRGFTDGVAQADNILEGLWKGTIAAGENAAFAHIYSSINPTAKGLIKMGALGGAQVVYSAAKEGRRPSGVEILEGVTHGIALGSFFKALSALSEGSSIATEKSALKKYEKRFNAVVEGKAKDITELSQIAEDFSQDANIRPEIREAGMQGIVRLANKKAEFVPEDFRLGAWKDGGKLRLWLTTLERNIENVAKTDAAKVKAEITEPIKANATAEKRMQTEFATEFQGPKFKGKGIIPGSKESRDMMRFGEKRMTEGELKSAYPKKWEAIKAADARAREIYDTTLKQINDVLVRNGEDPIPYRQDYYRHQQEMDLFDMMGGFQLTKGEMLPGYLQDMLAIIQGKKSSTDLAGIIKTYHAGRPKAGFEKARLGDPNFVEDGVLATQNYLRSAGKIIHHTDSVQRLRALEQFIRAQSKINATEIREGKAVTPVDLSNFVAHIKEFGDMMAGQPSEITKLFENRLTKSQLGIIKYLQQSPVTNMVSGNVSMFFMNLLAAPQLAPVITSHPEAVIKGITTSFLNIKHKPELELEGVKSDLFARRHPVEYLPKNWQEKMVDDGMIIAKFSDRLMTQTLIASKYWAGRAEGQAPEKAMKEADTYAARVLGDRTTGQKPLAFDEQYLKVATSLQLEINNLWQWLVQDIPQEYKGQVGKALGVYLTYAIIANVQNTIYEKIMGRRPGLDPLFILATLSGQMEQDQGKNLIERTQIAGNNLFGNIPFAQTFIQGGRFPASAAWPDMEKAIGDPEHQHWIEFAKPLYYWSPFGWGGQAKKTLEGTMNWMKGYTASPSGKPKFGIEQDFVNFMRGFLFGKNSFPEAVRHYNLPRRARR